MTGLGLGSRCSGEVGQMNHPAPSGVLDGAGGLRQGFRRYRLKEMREMTESQPRAHHHKPHAPRMWVPGALWLLVALLIAEVLLYTLLSVLFRL